MTTETNSPDAGAVQGEAQNQCDGCARGLPLVEDLHVGANAYDLIGCTADRYGEPMTTETDRPDAGASQGERLTAPTTADIVRGWLTPPPALEPRALAQEIATDLLTNGAGQEAQRLVLELPGGRNAGGWARSPLVDRIAMHLAPYATPAPSQPRAEASAGTQEREGDQRLERLLTADLERAEAFSGPVPCLLTADSIRRLLAALRSPVASPGGEEREDEADAGFLLAGTVAITERVLRERGVVEEIPADAVVAIMKAVRATPAFAALRAQAPAALDRERAGCPGTMANGEPCMLGFAHPGECSPHRPDVHAVSDALKLPRTGKWESGIPLDMAGAMARAGELHARDREIARRTVYEAARALTGSPAGGVERGEVK